MKSEKTESSNYREEFALDSVTVEMYDLENNLLMSANSLQDTITHLETTQSGHNYEVKLIIKRDGWINDTITTSLDEEILNERTYDLVKEKVEPEEAVAYFWRKVIRSDTEAGT